MNVNNNDYFRHLVDTVGRGSAGYFAINHHVSTRDSWVEEEYQALSRKFARSAEARDLYLSDYLDFRKEATRRAIENSRNSNQFTFVVQHFNPNIHIAGGNTPRTQGHDTDIFQSMARILEDQKGGLVSFRENFGGRFISEEDFEVRLTVLQYQFNEAIASVNDIFRGFINDLGAHRVGISASEAEAAILRAGDLIMNHIWSGGSADDVNEILANSDVVRPLNQLHQAGSAWHGQFRPTQF